jgi:hypothetical protein
MTQSDRTVLRRLTGAAPERRVTTDDLQGLLLQVTFALLMIFIIAYFIFVDQQKKARAEELLALNRQKLTLAVEKVAEDRRIGYGLNALMTQGVDGKRSFDPDQFVRRGAIRLSGAAKTAFASGAKAAFADYSDPSALARRWRAEVLAAAGLAETALTDDERVWFGKVLEVTIENVRLDVRGVQRALAARLLRWWIENPKTLPGYAQAASAESLAVFAGQVASLLKSESLERVAAEIGGEVLP